MADKQSAALKSKSIDKYYFFGLLRIDLEKKKCQLQSIHFITENKRIVKSVVFNK